MPLPLAVWVGLQAETQESRASEETTFLADQVEQLLKEKQHLKASLQKLEQENQSLLAENELLRGECADLMGEANSVVAWVLSRGGPRLALASSLG